MTSLFVMVITMIYLFIYFIGSFDLSPKHFSTQKQQCYGGSKQGKAKGYSTTSHQSKQLEV